MQKWKWKKYLKNNNQLIYKKFLVWLKIYTYFKNVSQGFRLKNINKTRNYYVEEIEQNELMSEKHKKVCTTLNYIDRILILASAVTGCIQFLFLLLC